MNVRKIKAFKEEFMHCKHVSLTVQMYICNEANKHLEDKYTISGQIKPLKVINDGSRAKSAKLLYLPL